MQLNRNSEQVQRIVARVNGEIGRDISQLHRAATLADYYKQRIRKIGEELKCEDAQNNSIFKSVFRSVKQANNSIEFQLEKLLQFREKLTSKITESQDALKGANDDLATVRKIQQLSQYLHFIQDIQEISEALKTFLTGKDEAKLLNAYLALYEGNDCENSVVGRLKDVEAPFLKAYAISTAVYWHKELREKFSSELEAALKAMHWCGKEDDLLMFTPTRDLISKAQLLAEYLFLLKSPDENAESALTITPSIICQPLSVVTKLLLAPYRQRFMYHFTGNRQTNRMDKPEWFYTQILNWGKQTHLFVGKTFQVSAMNAGLVNFNIRLEFVRGLVQLTIEKLAVDIEVICRDENLFAHFIDETLAFEVELRELFGYPAIFPSAVSVLTQPLYLLKWISLEEHFCAFNVDEILLGEDPWILMDPSKFDDDLKIPRCADQFMRLLDAIKDRYYTLTQPGHQLQFLALQLELIDNFRRRLVQLHSSGLINTIAILNAVNYVTMVLREWGENVHYLHLHAALVGHNASEIGSVFQQPIDELQHWTNVLVMGLALNTVNEVKAKSLAYRHECWSTMPEQNSKEPFILSASAAEMFLILVTVLHKMDGDLSANLFNATLRLMASQIDDYFFDSLVNNARFSSAGAAQFSYDLTRNLFPLFGQYIRRPDLLLKKLNDSAKLLNAALGTAMLLYETLASDEPLEHKLQALAELGVVNLQPKICIDILERRMDIKPILT